MTLQQRASLLQQTIPVSWLPYGVHGDEISSTDASLLVIYHLLPGKDDATADKILADSIIVIDPSQNPDGRARCVHHFQQNLGLEPFNPFISARQIENLDLYGKGSSKASDRVNFDYFTREAFSIHFPGYGDTWPAFQDAIGLAFEMATARGLVQRKDTGELVTYRAAALSYEQHCIFSKGDKSL
jgi:hypothetical protein